jgi:alkanesulfonate monooxygenase SsuD/methylene tetrahydromethanopterin reductase-like flavin-dependent oxidoreductase (luciferase family)
MKFGVIIPEGVDHEFDGWDPRSAWGRAVEIARHAERLGYESAWMYDHFHTDPVPVDEITFEAFTGIAGIGLSTERIRLGHLVLAAGYRNAALVAKMAGTLDVITGGRFELGFGAGWKEDEYLAYGYDFPPLKERKAVLADTLAIAAAMLSGRRATHAGEHRTVADAVNVPVGLQKPRVPILVGGNGPKVTFRLAARYADELNLDGLTPEQVAAALPTVRERCEEVGRDPSTLRISVHLWGPVVEDDGDVRTERLAAYRDLGVSRVIAQLHASVADLEVLDRFREDALGAGAEPA